MDAETMKFKIGDDEYELPEVDDLTMDEWEIIYNHSGLILDDFAPVIGTDGHLDEEAEAKRLERLRHPGFNRAMLQISYQRANPAVKRSEAERIAKEAKLIPALVAMADIAVTEDESPLAETTEPNESSKKSSVGSSANGLTTSAASSDEPASEPTPTGTPA